MAIQLVFIGMVVLIIVSLVQERDNKNK